MYLYLDGECKNYSFICFFFYIIKDIFLGHSRQMLKTVWEPNIKPYGYLPNIQNPVDGLVQVFIKKKKKRSVERVSWTL